MTHACIYNCYVHQMRSSIVSPVQAIPLAVILGGALVWWSQQHPCQPSNSSSKTVSNDILAALDKEAANSTAQYWFGPKDPQQQDTTK